MSINKKILMKKKLLFLFFILPIYLPLRSQSFPREMHYSTDGHKLMIGDLPNTGLYDQAQIKTIYLTFSQPDYWTQMDNSYWAWTKQEIPATMVVDGVTYDSVGVRFKGQSSFQQITSSDKKPFGISLGYAHPNQKIMGYKSLNLVNAFMDPSFIREIFYQNRLKNHIPEAKSTYVKLYINGQYWGLYQSMEQLNKEYYKEWYLSNKGSNWRADRKNGAWSPYGDGTGGLNYLGTDTTLYEEQYELKATSKLYPWYDLVHTCAVLNNTPLNNLSTQLPSVLDIDRTLWFLASELLFSDDDSYIQKGRMDYCVYWEKETGRIVPQEYDGNTVMNPAFQYWSPFYHADSVNYPLMNRLFAIPEYLQRYLAHLRTIIKEYFDPTTSNLIIDTYKNQIDSIVQGDPKKIYTYNQFQNEIPVLKNFITSRRNFLNANSEVAEVAPLISNVAWYVNGNQWAVPNDLQITNVRARATATAGIYQMNLFYSNSLVGNFIKTQMFDDGMHNDLVAGDGIYGAAIPTQVAGSIVRFYVEAVANNTSKSVSYEPVGAEHDVYIYTVAPELSANTAVVINELMASNASVVTDNAGQYDDWIELYNKSSQTIDITGFALTDNPNNLRKWMFASGTTIPSHGYLIVWADKDSIQGPLHCNFNLSSSSGHLMLLDNTIKLIDSVTYHQQIIDKSFSRVPNGIGQFSIQPPTYAANNDGTSVEEISDDANFMHIRPNPSNNTVEIEVDKNVEQTLEIINSLGARVYKEKFVHFTKIDVSRLSPGTYFIQCGLINKKLVIQH
jgi:hypothetical protein